VYGEFRTGIITLKLMVECKDYGEKKVGIEEINKFAGVVAVARNLGIVDKGLFVTTRGYTAEAKNNAQAAGIEITTFEELSTQLVDFDDYLEKV
jgi:restriction endonuclease Mrr